MKNPYGIHWFRRDLRVAGNSSLLKNWKTHQGRVVGLFCFDSQFLSRKDFSHNRFAFFLKTLKELKLELNKIGSDLLVVDAPPEKAFPKIFHSLKHQPSLITFNRDYEPFARARDEKIKAIFNQNNVPYGTERDHLILEPQEVTKDSGEFYQIYTPFSKKWFDVFKKNKDRVNKKTLGIHYLEKLVQDEFQYNLFDLKWTQILNKDFPLPDSLEIFINNNSKHTTVPIPNAGSAQAFKQLKNFKNKIDNYLVDRDYPSVEGTSHLSLFFKNGSLTPAQAIAELGLENINISLENSKSRFLKEIIWREFYYSILYHCPRVEKESFNEKYKNLKWQNNKKWFEKWCRGETGFPIVDAGMRQLNTTGWMHNRVRMIVASFLTKDLLIDWRWGENYFMQKLLDGDLAPNNGGWQWAASTGCDPQPYFRIFNPYLQSQKFDPEGAYIRKFIPELKNCAPKLIHSPAAIPGYPEPLVNHAHQKILALEMFKSI